MTLKTFTARDGARLAFRDEGAGLPVLCLAGLTRNSTDSHDALLGATDHHKAHLNEHFELPQNGRGIAVIKALGTIAALENEGVPFGRQGKLTSQTIHFPCSHKRRQLRERLQRVRQFLRIVVNRLLQSLSRLPRIGRPSGVHSLIVSPKQTLVTCPCPDSKTRSVKSLISQNSLPHRYGQTSGILSFGSAGNLAVLH